MRRHVHRASRHLAFVVEAGDICGERSTRCARACDNKLFRLVYHIYAALDITFISYRGGGACRIVARCLLRTPTSPGTHSRHIAMKLASSRKTPSVGLLGLGNAIVLILTGGATVGATRKRRLLQRCRRRVPQPTKKGPGQCYGGELAALRRQWSNGQDRAERRATSTRHVLETRGQLIVAARDGSANSKYANTMQQCADISTKGLTNSETWCASVVRHAPPEDHEAELRSLVCHPDKNTRPHRRELATIRMRGRVYI